MRVLIVDDHAIVCQGLQAILTTKPGVEIIGTASNGRDALDLVLRLRPDIVIMDVSMPDQSGVGATRRILTEAPGTKVIALSMHSDRRYVVAMFKAGASGYVLKDSESDELLRVLDHVSNGRQYLSPAIAGVVVEAVVNGPSTSEPHHLTRREEEVLQLVAEGATSKEIASRMSISPTTVESYRRLIMSKLSLHTVAELTKFAVREGITSLDR